MKFFAASMLILAASAVGDMMMSGQDNMSHTHDNMSGGSMGYGSQYNTMQYGSQRDNISNNNMMMYGGKSNMMTDKMMAMYTSYQMPYPKSSMKMSQMMQEEMMYVPGYVMSCIKTQCEDKCMMHAEKQMKMMKMTSCNSCLMKMCPMKMGQPSFDRTNCTDQAYKTCVNSYECQQMTTDDMSKMKMCKMCKDGCFPEYMKQMVRTKMATVVSCRTKCDTGNSCPEPMSCMDCLTKTCSTIGESYKKMCTNSVRGAGICKTCGKKEPDETMQQKCKMCRMDCVKDSLPESRQGMPRGMGMSRVFGEFMYLPATSKTCLNTKCSSKCPSNEAMMKKMKSMNEDCQMCLMQKCPFQDGMPSFDKEICHKSAYAMCTSMLKCPAMSMVEKNEKKMCKMCTDECIPASVKVTVRSAMKSDAYCRTQCRTLYNCPAPDPITCQMCIRKACAQSQSRSCFMDTRKSGACPTCPTMQMDRQSMAKCFECNMKCDPIARERMQTSLQCTNNCKLNYGCPEAPNPQGCRICIQKYCQNNQSPQCMNAVRQQRLCMDCEPRQQVSQSVVVQCVQCMMKCRGMTLPPGFLPPSAGGAQPVNQQYPGRQPPASLV